MSEQTSSPPTRRPLFRGTPATILLLSVFVFLALVRCYRVSSVNSGIDFYQFWLAGRSVVSDNRDNIYTESGRAVLGGRGYTEATLTRDPLRQLAAGSRRVLETYSTPFLYVTFGAFSSNDYSQDLQRYRMVSLGGFALGILLLSRLLEQTLSTTLAVLGFLLIWFEPLASELRVGNVNCLQLFGVALYAFIQVKWRHTHRNVLAGCVMGLLVAFKPNLVIVAVIVLTKLVLDKQWILVREQLIGMILGGSLAVGSSSVVLGSLSCWFDFFTSLRALPDSIIRVEQGNFALSLFLRSWFGVTKVPYNLVIVVAFGVLLLATRKRHGYASGDSLDSSVGRTIVRLGAVGCLGLVLLPGLAWLHYFVLVVPALLAVLPNTDDARPRWRKGADWLFVAVIWFALGTNPFVPLDLQFTQSTFGTVLVSATLLLLLRLLVTSSRVGNSS